MIKTVIVKIKNSMPGFLAVHILLIAITISGCSQKIVALSEMAEEPEKIYVNEYTEGSLWPGENSKNMLFIDSKAKKVGDIVTISISENSSATKKATTDTSKESAVGVAATGLLGLPSHLGLTNLFGLGSPFDPSMNASSDNNFKGSGTTTREDQFTATIAVTIVEVLPNGNFRVKGDRNVSLNNEDQILSLTGIIRPEDIAFDNTIDSKLIADARITYSGSGVLADKQRVGWGVRLLDVVWPF